MEGVRNMGESWTEVSWSALDQDGWRRLVCTGPPSSPPPPPPPSPPPPRAMRCDDDARRKNLTHTSFPFSFSSRWHRGAPKSPYGLRPASQQSPQGFPRNCVNVCLVEHRSFSNLEGRVSASSFLRSWLGDADRCLEPCA